jgi:dolichol-phosphate mannosyltransferase
VTGQAPTVTVVIPAKNEERTIAGVIERCRPFAQQIIVIDGRSTDGTASAARGQHATVVADGGRGKGQAIRTAIPLVTGDIAVFVDADGSHTPEDIPRLIAPIVAGQADHVTASRLIGGSSELHGGFDEFMRLAGSAFITACINRRFAVRLSDSQNGFRAIRTTLLKSLALREDTTTIEQEMIMQTLKRRGRMAEIGSHEHARQHGTSHIRVWRDAPRYFVSLIRGLW